MSKVAVVTSSHKGVGFSIVKGLLQQFKGVVYLTSYDETKGKAAVAELNKLGLEPEYYQLDVLNRESIEKFRDHLKEKHGGIDILVNNAAKENPMLLRTLEARKHVVDLNYYSILMIEELLFPLVRDNGRILNICGDCFHLSSLKSESWQKRLSKTDISRDDINEFVNWYMDGTNKGTLTADDIVDESTVAAYTVTKIVLNALTSLQQKDLLSRNISINATHPGLVTTDDAADTPIYLVLDAPDGLKGTFVA